MCRLRLCDNKFRLNWAQGYLKSIIEILPLLDKEAITERLEYIKQTIDRHLSDEDKEEKREGIEVNI